MTDRIKIFLAIANVICALALIGTTVSLNKTLGRVNANTLTTLNAAGDPHADFIRHMLKFVTDDATTVATFAFFAAGFLIASAAFLWYSRQVAQCSKS